MKLLATGDFHLGAGTDYGPRPGDRLLDQAQVLDRIVALAREEDVAAVLFAGDAFERRYPTPAELMVWRGFSSGLRESEIPLFSIAGNHDVATAALPTGLEVVGGCGRTPEVCHLGDSIGLATLPWTPPAHLVASQNGGDRDAIHERAAELLLKSARGLRAMVDGPCILLAHWSVSGASLPNGLPVDQLREPVLDSEALEALDFDAVVLGHIHKPQVFGAEQEDSTMFYVGSPMPLNFGEAETRHGFFIFDTEEHYASFHPIASRPFVTVSADLTATSEVVGPSGGSHTLRYEDLGFDETDALAAAIATHLPLTDAVVRLRYKATAEQARRIDTAAIRELIADAGASKLYAVQAEIVRSERVRVEGVDETVEETQALDLWLAAQEATLAPEQFAALSQKHVGYLEQVRA